MRQILFALMIACISITNIQYANATPSAPPVSTALNNSVAASSDLTLRDTCTNNTQYNQSTRSNAPTNTATITPANDTRKENNSDGGLMLMGFAVVISLFGMLMYMGCQL